jgi:hypothetical protein
VSYKSVRLLVEAINSQTDTLRKQLMVMPPDVKCSETIDGLNDLRKLVDELAEKADRPSIDDVTKLTPGDYVATMKPLVGNYHRQLMMVDKLAPCLCEDLQASGVVLMLIGDGKTVIRTATDPNRPEVQLAVEIILASLDDGMRKVTEEGVQEAEKQLGIVNDPDWSPGSPNQLQAEANGAAGASEVPSDPKDEP